MADPAVRDRVATLVRATPPVRAQPRLHVVPVTLSDDPGAARALATITTERARTPTRDQPFVNLVAQQRKQAFLQQVVRILPLQTAPGRIARPIPLGASGAAPVSPEIRPTPAAPEQTPRS